jgi:hypothetical protein
MEARSSETLATNYETTRCHNLEDNNLNLCHRENLKSHKYYFLISRRFVICKVYLL